MTRSKRSRFVKWGKKERRAVLHAETEHFAVTRLVDLKDGYTVTHMKSGAKMAGYRLLADAKKAMRFIESWKDDINWDFTKPNAKPVVRNIKQSTWTADRSGFIER